MTDVHAPLSERLEHLVTSGSALVAEVQLERVLDQVALLSRRLLHARYAAVGLLAADRKSLASFTTVGIPAEERARMGPLPKGHGILGVLIRDQKPLRLPDRGGCRIAAVGGRSQHSHPARPGSQPPCPSGA